MNVIAKLNTGSFRERAQVAFEIFDTDGDEHVSEEEFFAILQCSLQENRMVVEDEVALRKVVTEIFQKANASEQGVKYEQFMQILEDHDLANSLHIGGLDARRERAASDSFDIPDPGAVWMFIVNHRKQILLVFIVLALNAWCFEYKFKEYDHGTGFDLMGYTLPIAKGCAEMMKVTIVFIMIFMCRMFITVWRHSFVGKYLIEFDDAVEIHKKCAILFLIAMWVHVVAHIINVERIIDPNNYDEWLAHDESESGTTQPTRMDVYTTATSVTGIGLTVLFSIVYFFALEWPRRWKCTCFGYFGFNDRNPLFDLGDVYERDENGRELKDKNGNKKIKWFWGRVNDFRMFWATHHIVFVCFVLLIIHPWPGMCWDDCPGEDGVHGDTWQWLLIPCCMYIAERIVRELRNRSESFRPEVYSIVDNEGNEQATRLVTSDKAVPVLRLRLKKPPSWLNNPCLQAGMYGFILCKDISEFEWHPFTLTSAPHEDFVEMHVRALGDWTTALATLFKERIQERKAKYLEIEVSKAKGHMDTKEGDALLAQKEIPWPSMGLEGPFGAPAQGYENFKVLLLVGGGIGITPFISILKDIQHKLNHRRCKNCDRVNHKHFPLKKVYFNYFNSDQESMLWFKDVTEQITIDDDPVDPLIEMHQHVTRAIAKDDFRSAAIKITQEHAMNMANEEHFDNVRRSQQAAAKSDDEEYKSMEGGYVGKDIVTGAASRTAVHFGRPNWPKIFQYIRKKHPLGKIGVFYCGMSIVGQQLNECCTNYSETNACQFFFHEEHF
jgi:predicted ferric reductase